MKYLFFDTETTGLPRDYRAPATDVDNWPRMVQLAWLSCDFDDGCAPEFVERDVVSELISPGGKFEIPQSASAIHGITTRRAESNGSMINDVIGSFNNAMNRADAIVAHNIEFDRKIVGAEAERLEWSWVRRTIEDKPSICTKEISTDYVAIPQTTGYHRNKWPTLTELHRKLFGRDFGGAHDARNDVLACARCFFELKRIGVIQ